MGEWRGRGGQLELILPFSLFKQNDGGSSLLGKLEFCWQSWKKGFLRQKLPILPGFEELFALEFSCLSLKDANYLEMNNKI